MEVLLTSFNNVYIISFEKLHKEAVWSQEIVCDKLFLFNSLESVHIFIVLQ